MTTALAFILVFGLLVFIHEFGHFITAKLSGIIVHEFALGMGPKLLNWKGKETTYSLRLLPIGGYVRMEGEDEASDNPGAFNAKSPWKRLAVIVAGPFMNFVLAIVIITGLFMAQGFPVNKIGGLVEGDFPAQKAGLLVGDEIVEIDGQAIKSWNEVVDKITEASDDQLEISIKREGAILNVKLDATREEKTGRRIIGILPAIQRSFFLSLKNAFLAVGFIIKLILGFLVSLLMGQGDLSQVSGPVGIYKAVGEASQAGGWKIFDLTAMLSINLGLINLLPLPALDGGRILFILIELLRGKPVDAEKEGFVHLVGFVLLMSLMILLVFKDLHTSGVIV